MKWIKTKTTPRKLDSSDNKAELSGFDEIDLSDESKVFDSDEDPEYRPSDKDDNVYKMSRMFKLRYQRQLEPDQTDGTSRSMDYVSDEYSEPSTPKNVCKKKKTNANVKHKRDNTKNIPASKRKKKESNYQRENKKERWSCWKEKKNVNIEDERQNIE